MYTLTFLLKEGEEIASHYGICVKHPVSYITHKGMPPRDAMADTVRRLIMAGYVNEIYEITGLTKLGDVEIYAGYRYYSNEMSRHPVSTDWNYIRSVAYNRSFLLHTDLARVAEAFLDWQDEDGIYEWEDGNNPGPSWWRPQGCHSARRIPGLPSQRRTDGRRRPRR